MSPDPSAVERAEPDQVLAAGTIRHRMGEGGFTLPVQFFCAMSTTSGAVTESICKAARSFSSR